MPRPLTFPDLEVEDQQHYVELINRLKQPYTSDEARARAALTKAVNPARLILTAGKSATVYASVAAFYTVRDELFPKASPAFTLCGFMTWLKLKYKRDEVSLESFPRFPAALALTEAEVAGLEKLAGDIEHVRLEQKMEDIGPVIAEGKRILQRIMNGESVSDEEMKKLQGIADDLKDIMGTD